ncbi:hypothetical protein QE250_06710, partial [Chromatiaceae bacterium AAb-1]|nr:hypothetical protein [Chromatiaceae bacterium AAb-1]
VIPAGFNAVSYRQFNKLDGEFDFSLIIFRLDDDGNNKFIDNMLADSSYRTMYESSNLENGMKIGRLSLYRLDAGFYTYSIYIKKMTIQFL